MTNPKLVESLGPFVNILYARNDELKMIQSHSSFIEFRRRRNLVFDETEHQSAWVTQHNVGRVAIFVARFAANDEVQHVGVPPSALAHVENSEFDGILASQIGHTEIMTRHHISFKSLAHFLW